MLYNPSLRGSSIQENWLGSIRSSEGIAVIPPALRTHTTMEDVARMLAAAARVDRNLGLATFIGGTGLTDAALGIMSRGSVGVDLDATFNKF